MRVLLLISSLVLGATVFPGSLAAAPGAKDYLKQPDTWFAGEEAKRAATNILRNQTEHGGWVKNFDTTSDTATAPADALGRTSFDNGATLHELRFLARMYEATAEEAYGAAFDRGFATVLAAQYPNGGWPQVFPPPANSYHRYITFNDGAMVNIMLFLREVVQKELYSFVAPEQRARAQEAFDRGIACILKCQIYVNGRLTAWCAQHDEVDLSPRTARRYELRSLSGAESVGIVKLLMTLQTPTPEVARAIEAAMAWFEESKITGYRINEEDGGEVGPAGKDATAPPIWARMYDIESNQPLVSHLDGVPHYGMSEIGHRRSGYKWFGRWPERLLALDYPRWKAKRSRAEGGK